MLELFEKLLPYLITSVVTGGFTFAGFIMKQKQKSRIFSDDISYLKSWKKEQQKECDAIKENQHGLVTVEEFREIKKEIAENGKLLAEIKGQLEIMIRRGN